MGCGGLCPSSLVQCVQIYKDARTSREREGTGFPRILPRVREGARFPRISYNPHGVEKYHEPERWIYPIA